MTDSPAMAFHPLLVEVVDDLKAAKEPAAFFEEVTNESGGLGFGDAASAARTRKGQQQQQHTSAGSGGGFVDADGDEDEYNSDDEYVEVEGHRQFSDAAFGNFPDDFSSDNDDNDTGDAADRGGSGYRPITTPNNYGGNKSALKSRRCCGV
eukprot:TRINITY_DN14963_c0_g1_i1.p1 TRINITY_DN14963_c0_g1~~TRINITY_DN14963_c0_g1_i1.p1  ORF type:complete len:151 (-),score=84.26 TRINITY_DN14963_c0_g1_i1:906-1358(-)